MSYAILIVDDSSIVRSVIARAIELSGVEGTRVVEAANGQEALRILSEQWIDLVFTDIHMPVMGGLELIAKMSADGVLGSIPIVVVSSDGTVADSAAASDGRVRAFIRKPFSPEQLRDSIHSVLGLGEVKRHG